MKAMGFIRGLLLAFGLLPGFVQASDADAFVAASRTVQAQLLEQWAATPDPQRLPLLTALSREALLTDSTNRLSPARRRRLCLWERPVAQRER